MKKLSTLLLIAIYFFINPGFSQSKKDLSIEQEARKASVAISYRTNIGLSGNAPGSHVGSGGIVSLEKGIIITNSHVSGNGPASIEIEFYNQEKVSAKILYVDPWTDFAFLQFDPESIQNPNELANISFGSHKELQVGQNVFIIGNNSGVGFSRKDGKINRLFNYSSIDGFPNIQRPNHALHLSMDATGGSSGSVVFNEKGEVIGLFNSGYQSATENFALRVDYILDVLPIILENAIPKKGEIFTLFSKISTNSARVYFKMPSDIIASANYVLKVESIAKNTPADEVLLPGDLIYRITDDNGVVVDVNTAEDNFFYNFEKLINMNVNKNIYLTLYRQGEDDTIQVTLPVKEINNGMVERFSIFSDIVVQDIPSTFAVSYGIAQDGVYLAQMNQGHSFTEIFNTSKDNVPYVMIHKINNVDIHSLDDFNTWAKSLVVGEHNITVTACNYYNLYTSPKCYPASFDVTKQSFESYTWDQTKLDYTEEN